MKNWFNNIVISKKLNYGFFVISVLGVLIGLIGIFSTVKLLNDQQESYSKCTIGIENSSGAEIDFLKLKSDVTDLFVYYDTNKDKYINNVTSQLQETQNQITLCSNSISDSNNQEKYKAVETAFSDYKRSVDEIVSSAKSGKPSTDVFSILDKQQNNFQSTLENFSAVTQENASLAADDIKSSKTLGMTMIFVLIGVIILSIILSIFISRFISGSLSYEIDTLTAIAEHLAVGDIDVYSLASKNGSNAKYRKDEIGRLAAAFYKIITGTVKLSKETQAIAGGDLTTEVAARDEKDVLGNALKKLVDDFNIFTSSIIESADQVDAGAKQVSSSSMTLSQGATEQASSIEELSASVNEISQRIKENADSAVAAKELSQRTEEIMKSSKTNMDLARNAMEEITVTSKNISKVIKAIDDIAFQTNILALNAAVEAARAGEAGKGFAVVADEVRNLSQKSAEAAKDTTSLIEDSIQAVDKGTKLVICTSDSFSDVAEKTAEVVKLVEAISTQAQEQAAAAIQISSSIEQVSSVVQMNSATSEESAAASEELLGQANSLKASVSKFKVKEK